MKMSRVLIAVLALLFLVGGLGAPSAEAQRSRYRQRVYARRHRAYRRHYRHRVYRQTYRRDYSHNPPPQVPR